jgi:hypothetical protein
MRLGLFELLTEAGAGVTDLALSLEVDAETLDKLLLALEAMGLAERCAGGWRRTPLADRTLVQGRPAYQGDMVLHNTQPEYIERVFRFGEQLGLPPDIEEPGVCHPRFMRAMCNTAAGGQADVLLAAVDLTGCRTLLDIGGASGPYSIALCRKYPALHSLVLDIAETVPLAAPLLEEAGLADRVRVVAHDYRHGPFPGPVDAVLVSNVLRGKKPLAIHDILGRVLMALKPGGRLFVTDLFTGDPRAGVRMRAALFGLHLPGGANYSLDQMARALQEAGFELLRVEHLAKCVVMNGLIEARNSPRRTVQP